MGLFASSILHLSVLSVIMFASIYAKELLKQFQCQNNDFDVVMIFLKREQTT